MPGEKASPVATPLSCPSGQPGMEDARIFGVIGGTVNEPRVDYLKRDAIVSGDMLDQLGEIDSARVFRFSARCENGRCAQFGNGECTLGKRIAEHLDPVTQRLPSCLIRATCRWHREQGDTICFRCPQVVTQVPGHDNMVAALLVSS